ncbi:MAG: cytochrome c [Flavihumibacter sp.]|nr:cytochrome c [Flavihumibacter sp.]
MKKLLVLSAFFVAIAIAQSCSDVKRNPNNVYMPDMAYSRAYETYADHKELADSGIFYNSTPVAGTVKRGEGAHYELLKDTTGGYNASAALQNPLPALSADDMVEAERLYLVNCGICHGAKLDGKGPLVVRPDGSDGPYLAAPANLIDPGIKEGIYYKMSEGTMFYSITYGRNLMGGYASQVTPKQRWMIVHYIKSKQREKSGAAAAPAAADTTKAAK